MRTSELNAEVLVSSEPLVCADGLLLTMLKERATRNVRKRVRLCAHGSTDDKVHEMLIVQAKGIYIRPHRHLAKAESFHVVEGTADVVLFDDTGGIVNSIPMGVCSSGRTFYCRIFEPRYHTIVIQSDFFVFHETTEGPLDRSKTEFAPWSPEEDNAADISGFMGDLLEKVSVFTRNHTT